MLSLKTNSNFMLDVSTLFHKESVCYQEKREDKEERCELSKRENRKP
jgi:hypothetical protein